MNKDQTQSILIKMKIQGTVKKILPSANNTKRLSILIDDEWFSLFTDDGKTNIKRGDIIEADYITKGMFHNINAKSIKVVGSSPIIDIVDENKDNISERIAQQVCLKAASSYSKTPEENIRNAKILYKCLDETW